MRVLPDSQSIRLADHESARLCHMCTCDQPGGEGLAARLHDSKQDTAAARLHDSKQDTAGMLE